MLLWLYVNIHKLPQPCERALFQNIWQVLCARCNTSHCDEARGDEQNKSCVVIRFGHYHRNNGASTATGNQPFCVTRLTTNQDYNMHNQQYHQLHLKFFTCLGLMPREGPRGGYTTTCRPSARQRGLALAKAIAAERGQPVLLRVWSHCSLAAIVLLIVDLVYAWCVRPVAEVDACRYK